MSHNLTDLRPAIALAAVIAALGFAGCSGAQHDLTPPVGSQSQAGQFAARPAAQKSVTYKMLVPLTATIDGDQEITFRPVPGARTTSCPGVNSDTGTPLKVDANAVATVTGYSIADFLCSEASTSYVIVMVTNPSDSPNDASAVPVTLPGKRSGTQITFEPELPIAIPSNTPMYFFVASY